MSTCMREEAASLLYDFLVAAIVGTLILITVLATFLITYYCVHKRDVRVVAALHHDLESARKKLNSAIEQSNKIKAAMEATGLNKAQRTLVQFQTVNLNEQLDPKFKLKYEDIHFVARLGCVFDK